MPTNTLHILEDRTLQTGDAMNDDDALDLALYNTLDLVIHVLTAAEGDAPTLTLKHVAFNVFGRFLAFTPKVSVDLSAVGSHWFRIDAFTRYVGWFLSGTLTTDAVVTVELVAPS